MYCAEGRDNDGKANSIKIAAEQSFKPQFRPELLGGLNTLTAENSKVILIPYYAWANRGANEMTVWFNTK